MFGLTEGHPGMPQEKLDKQEERASRLKALYALADYLTDHPDFPIPSFTIGSCVWTKEEVLRLIRYGKWTKDPSGPWFYFYHSFHDRGDVRLWLAVNRELVCERTVTGTKWVEPHPATPGYEEAIVEWICPDSIMKEA